MVVARNVLLVFHIIAAGCWIAGVPIAFALNRVAKRLQGPAAGGLGAVRGELDGFLGQVGGIGILITGLGLIGVDRYGFLGIGGATPTWLIIKQIIYIVLFILGVGILAPMSLRLRKQLASQAGGAPSADTQQLVSRLTLLGNLSHLLVFVNICLAVWKQPF